MNENIQGVLIGDDGICNYCTGFVTFIPYGESKLLKIFKNAQRKNRIYDALVPISGGKDSTYVLYLAVTKYHLNVLTYTFDNGFISDLARIKAILQKNGSITKKMANRFLIYPKLNFITSYLYTRSGRFGKKVNILYYLNIPSDKEIGNILKKEMGWIESDQSEYTRHFDCLAEPFTNYIREKRFGYSRRLPQLSNMIRNKELTREEALRICMDDNKDPLPSNYEFILSSLNLTESDIEEIGKIPLHVFGDKKSPANMLFARIRGLIKKSVH